MQSKSHFSKQEDNEPYATNAFLGEDITQGTVGIAAFDDGISCFRPRARPDRIVPYAMDVVSLVRLDIGAVNPCANSSVFRVRTRGFELPTAVPAIKTARARYIGQIEQVVLEPNRG